MQIERIGFTPIKSGRHVEHPSVEIDGQDGTIDFGMYAGVTSPGLVERGQAVTFSP